MLRGEEACRGAAMSLITKFVTLLVVGSVVLCLMVYISTVTFPDKGKGRKLVHKERHHSGSFSVVESAGVKAPPTTADKHTALAERVKSRCKEEMAGKHGAGYINTERFHHILVDDRYKMLYCYIPKVACTNWRRVLLVLSGKVKVRNLLDIGANEVHRRYKDLLPRLSEFSKAGAQHRLDHYFKFMFVREPFERLLSAWRNKFQNVKNAYFRKHFAQSILRRARDRGDGAGKDGATVRFEEFLSYLVDPLRTEQLNEHWATYQKLCLPCSVQYDFVGKYENIDVDADYVLRSVQAESVVRFPKRSDFYVHNQTSVYLSSFYRNISAPLLQRVYDFYKKDFELFDYVLPAELG